MPEITTCEQYVLTELDNAKQEIEDLKNKNEALNATAEHLAD